MQPTDFVTLREYQVARLQELIELINMLIMDDKAPYSRLVISYLTIAVSNLEISLMLSSSKFNVKPRR